jgi:DNA mismatch repair protein MSH3
LGWQPSCGHGVNYLFIFLISNAEACLLSILQDRVDAVEEIISSSSEKLVSLRDVLKNLPDLAKGICRIQYGKVRRLVRSPLPSFESFQCMPQELAVILPAFNKIGTAFEDFDSPSQVGFKSHTLNDIVASLPKLREPIARLLADINLKRASQGDKENLWTDPTKYPDISDYEMVCQAPLNAERGLIRSIGDQRRLS